MKKSSNYEATMLSDSITGPNAPDSPSAQLADFAANLRYENIPHAVVSRAQDLFLDWFSSALAGKGAPSVEAIESFAKQMAAGATGASEVLISRRFTTPL